MDLLYIVGTSTKWDHNELRYSLRSACEHLRFDRVVIAGHRPEWCIAENVPHPEGGHPSTNVTSKILHALSSGAVGSAFLLMWDDQYFLGPYDTAWTYKGLLSQDVEYQKAERSPNEWVLTCRSATLGLLRRMGIAEPLDFGCHMPFLMERDKAIETARAALAQPEPVGIAPLYWAMHGGEVRKGVDVNMRSWAGPPTGEVFSTGEYCEQDPAFREWIASRYPEPCRYESFGNSRPRGFLSWFGTRSDFAFETVGGRGFNNFPA